jgi:hypothetical protein
MGRKFIARGVSPWDESREFALAPEGRHCLLPPRSGLSNWCEFYSRGLRPWLFTAAAMRLQSRFNATYFAPFRYCLRIFCSASRTGLGLFAPSNRPLCGKWWGAASES